MEEEKAAAYYAELTRKGEGAARFKQGLGFSSDDNAAVPARASALPSTSSSFLSSFVKASSTPSTDSDVQKQARIESIQSKLKKKPSNLSKSSSRVSNDDNRDVKRDSDRYVRRRSRSRDDDRSRRRHRHRSRSRSRSRSRDKDEDLSRHRHRSRDRDDDRSRHRHRSRSRSRDKDEDRDRYRKRERERRKSRSRSRSFSDEERGGRGKGRRRSLSPPRDRRLEKSRGEEGKDRKDKKSLVDYAKLIDGYDKMSPAERVKAKMKLQLSETAKNDATNGMGSGWERFDFDKDAPLDEEEIEAGDDDKELVKHMGQSFRLQAVEARREEKIKATHDEAIFGTPSLPPCVDTDSEEEGDKYKRESEEAAAPLVASLISDHVLAKQQGSWRDRARKL